MNNRHRIRPAVSALVLSLSFTLLSGVAGAQPLVRAADLPAQARAALVADIAQAKLARPQAFEKVHAVRAEAVTLDRRKRGPIAPIAPLYRSLGKDALLPMLAELMDDTHAADAPASLTLSVRLGLLQAVGELRDDRAIPVLAAVVDQTGEDARIARTAAAAIGNIGSDAAVEALLARTARSGAARISIVAGLGSCRRAKAAGALAAMLDGTTDEATADALVAALGDVANAWAWQTSKVASTGERDVVANVAARALVAAFVSRDGRVRARAEKSLVLIGSAQANAELVDARTTADAPTQSAIDALIAKLDKSQLR